jgi:hypothetical protein
MMKDFKAFALKERLDKVGLKCTFTPSTNGNYNLTFDSSVRGSQSLATLTVFMSGKDAVRGTAYFENKVLGNKEYSFDISDTYKDTADHIKFLVGIYKMETAQNLDNQNKRPIKVANSKIEQEIDKELNDLWNRREYKS